MLPHFSPTAESQFPTPSTRRLLDGVALDAVRESANRIVAHPTHHLHFAHRPGSVAGTGAEVLM